MKNKIFFTSLYLLMVSFLMMILLIFVQKNDIYSEFLIVQEKIDINGKLKKEIFILNENKINISSIEYFTINYQMGSQNFNSNYLEYKDGLIYLKNIDPNNIISFKDTIVFYGPKISLLNYLLSCLY